MTSPIERMIDAAVGLTPEKLEELRARRRMTHITIRCPVCGKTQETLRKPEDPPNAAVLVLPCPADFPKEREMVRVEYLDAAGEPI